MNRLTEEKKIKIGLVCNKIATVLFILFFINTCVIITFNFTIFLILTIVIVALFTICCIVGHKCLKDYKPE